MPPLKRKLVVLSKSNLKMMAAESNIPMGFSPCDREKTAQINLRLFKKNRENALRAGKIKKPKP
jgi:hypothetical protein